MSDKEKKFRVVNGLPIPIGYHWSVGLFMDRFYEELINQKIMGIKCPKCGKVYVPPRSVCGPCWQKLSDWKEVKDQGVVENFTVAHVDIREADLKEPRIIGLIKLDGADTCVFGEIKGIASDKIKTGLKVKAVWADERKGRVKDISHYAPV
jgi:uncharacterized OB-fold protein